LTISSTTNRVSFTGNGVTTAFSFPYKFLANGDLVVIETVIATGVQTTKTITTHYTVSGAGDDAGGTVTMVTAPASTISLTIYRDPAATQTVDLVENDPLPVEDSLEAPLDKLTMMIQRLKDVDNRSLRQPEGDTANIDYLPAKVTRASKYMAFDADGDPIASSATSGSLASSFMDTVLDDTSGSAVIETLIDDMTAETAPATGDLVPISDVSANNGRKITLLNLLKVINALTAETSVAADDEIAIYDASESAANKATVENIVLGVAATAAEQETSTANNRVVTPLIQQRHPSALKARVRFNSAGTVADSYNVTSVTDSGAGDWTVVIATDFSAAGVSTASVTGGFGNSAGARANIFNLDAATEAGQYHISSIDGVDGVTRRDPSTVDEIHFLAFGDQ
jgi:hypothetical protein